MQILLTTFGRLLFTKKNIGRYLEANTEVLVCPYEKIFFEWYDTKLVVSSRVPSSSNKKTCFLLLNLEFIFWERTNSSLLSLVVFFLRIKANILVENGEWAFKTESKESGIIIVIIIMTIIIAPITLHDNNHAQERVEGKLVLLVVGIGVGKEQQKEKAWLSKNDSTFSVSISGGKREGERTSLLGLMVMLMLILRKGKCFSVSRNSSVCEVMYYECCKRSKCYNSATFATLVMRRMLRCYVCNIMKCVYCSDIYNYVVECF